MGATAYANLLPCAVHQYNKRVCKYTHESAVVKSQRQITVYVRFRDKQLEQHDAVLLIRSRRRVIHRAAVHGHEVG